jgi:ornithine carbamoyltransferase
MMKDLLRTADLTPADLGLLVGRAADLKKEPHRGISMLRGDSVVLYFEKPSTRTRLSFETAIVRLGGHPVFTGPSELQIARGEPIEDTARVASRYARAWIMRASRHSAVEQFARAATIPVVNALTDRHHPCQALADVLTMRERLGDLAGRTVAYLGAGNNVAHDLVQASALAGMRVRVATPRAFALDGALLERAAATAREVGGSVEVFEDARAAAKGADAIYTDVWSSMTDDPHQAELRRAALEPFRVDAALFALARPDAFFLHCLPCRRGEEVTAEIVDGPRSAVLDQAENRLHTAMAVLECLLQHEISGSKRA